MNVAADRASEAGAATTGTALRTALADVASSLRRSTVEVRTRRAGGGSGVVWSSSGLIVTNAHVARAGAATVVLWDGRELEGKVTARDPQRDLATLSVSADRLTPASIGNPGAVRAGDIVVALGHPLGVVGALALGIVHVIEPGTRADVPRWIRADIRLAPGNSGGPLADARGRVIGINTLIANGLGFAVPATTVSRFVAESGRRPRLGVVLRPVDLPMASGMRGLLVLEVDARSAAAAGGIVPGDVVLGIDGHRIVSAHELLTAVEQARPGSSIELELLRGQNVVRRHVVAPPPAAPDARAA